MLIITSTTKNILVSLLSIVYMIILQLSMGFGEMRMVVMINILLFFYLLDPGDLLLASGNTLTTLESFPSKAHPVRKDRITLLSVHYNTFNENNSELYCNGKQLDRFITESTTGQNTFSIGAANDKAENSKTQY